MVLRSAVWRIPLRYRIAPAGLPGRPDLVFARERVVVFCDGDFWHGRNLDARLAKLAAGHNAPYWTAKIRTNVERDARHTKQLEAAGWLVLRFWESDILRDVVAAAEVIADAVRARRQIV
jgi:DNA mismatch endonuclease (patch repair protein)